MSVEITTPHARASSPLGFSAKNTTAGRMSPATAATTGTAARARSVSSPMVNWLLTSSPTAKKKNVMSPSFTRCLTVSSAWNDPNVNPTWVFQKSE